MKKIISIISIILISITAKTAYDNHKLHTNNAVHVQTLSAQLEGLVKDKDAIMILLDQVEALLNQYRNKIAQLENENSTNLTEIERLNKVVESLTLENQSLRNELIQKETVIKDLQDQITKITSEKQVLEQEVKDLKVIIEDLRNQLAALKAENDRLQKELDDHDCESTISQSLQEFINKVTQGDIYKYYLKTPEGATSTRGGGFRVVKSIETIINGVKNYKYVIIFNTSNTFFGNNVELRSWTDGKLIIGTAIGKFDPNSLYLVTVNSTIEISNITMYLRLSGNKELSSTDRVYQWEWEQIRATVLYNSFTFN